jgi:taurine--2-oxoglutarate transaminase
MVDLITACKANNLWPFTHFNRMHVVPPLVITDQEMRDGLAIIDEALNVADSYYTGK